MKRAVTVAFLVGLSAALLGGPGSGAWGEPSLMVNGDFEAGEGPMPKAWSFSLYPGAVPAGDCLVRAEGPVRSGNWALKIDTGPVVGQDVSLVFNGAVAQEACALRRQELRLSGWVYVQPRTALRPIHMRLRTFGPDEQGQHVFLGDVLDVTVLGEPGKWVEFRAAGRVLDKNITAMDLHCSIGADVVPTVQFLDDLRLELAAAEPLALKPLRSWLWSDEKVIPVSVELSPAMGGGKTLSLRLLTAKGQPAAAWQRPARSGVIGLPLPSKRLAEGRYTLHGQVLGAAKEVIGSAESSLELVASPWEGAAGTAAAGMAAAQARAVAGFEALGSLAPTDAEDEVPAEEEPLSEDVPLGDWQARGYVVFSRHYLDLPSRLGRPRPGEVVGKTQLVRIFACPGEYEPVALSVWALRPLSGVSVTVSDLKSAKGVIPGGCVEVRVVRSLRNLPAFLERRPQVNIPQNQTQTFWLTLYVPSDARPGFYRGNLRLSAQGAPPTDVGLLVRVLPLKLPPPQKGYGFWWAMDGRWKGYYSDEREAALAQIRKQFVALREHGCNMVSCPVMPKMTRADDGTITYDFTQEHWRHCVYALADFFQIGRETGFLSAQHPIQYTGAESLHSHWVAREFGFERESAQFEAFYRDACRRIDDWAKQQGYTLAFACVDEIGNGVDRQREALRFYRVAQEAGVLTSVTDNSMHGGVHLMGQARFDEIIAMRLYNFIVPEMIESARASRDRLWLYNVGSAGWWAKLDRFVFGLFTERCGAEGCAQWAFQWPRGEAGPYRASEAGQETGWHYALPAPDGPLPTVAFEGVREGIDDARYLEVLRARDPKSPAASLSDIEPVSPRIRDYLDAHDATSFDCHRWRVARAAMEDRVRWAPRRRTQGRQKMTWEIGPGRSKIFYGAVSAAASERRG